jgi:hypothetical protein
MRYTLNVGPKATFGGVLFYSKIVNIKYFSILTYFPYNFEYDKE